MLYARVRRYSPFSSGTITVAVNLGAGTPRVPALIFKNSLNRPLMRKTFKILLLTCVKR
jgi:hypothetical protein